MKKSKWIFLQISLLLVLIVMVYATFKQDSNIELYRNQRNKVEARINWNGLNYSKTATQEAADIEPMDQVKDFSYSYNQTFNKTNDIQSNINNYSDNMQSYRHDVEQESNDYNQLPFVYNLSNNKKQDQLVKYVPFGNTTTLSESVDNSTKQDCHPIWPPCPPPKTVPVGDCLGVMTILLAIYISFKFKSLSK